MLRSSWYLRRKHASIGTDLPLRLVMNWFPFASAACSGVKFRNPLSVTGTH